jgi:hypothetical protein
MVREMWMEKVGIGGGGIYYVVGSVAEQQCD